MREIKQFFVDLAAFFPRIFREPWLSVKWEWEHRTEKNNRFKRRRKRNELNRIYSERFLKAAGRI